jgi:hypothetical protein
MDNESIEWLIFQPGKCQMKKPDLGDRRQGTVSFITLSGKLNLV